VSIALPCSHIRSVNPLAKKKYGEGGCKEVLTYRRPMRIFLEFYTLYGGSPGSLELQVTFMDPVYYLSELEMAILGRKCYYEI